MQDTRQMMADAKFFESYARFDDSKNRYESWDEAVDRVMQMHRQYYAPKMTDQLSDLIEQATDAYKQKLVLGAQRALQFGGEQLLKHQMRLYNCIGTYADRPAFFGEYFYALLCGCGVGFSVQFKHINALPPITLRTKQPKTHVVDDSIEGWAEALDVLISSYLKGGGKHSEYEGRKVYFDLSQIRPRGARISGGFKAPGPDPLRLSLDRIEYLLQGLVLKDREVQLRPIQVYDICMHAADAVLAGGVRRSATICVFSPDDHEMATAKTGNWYEENPQRARSNNSALILRDQVTRQQFGSLMENIKQYGEPGFVFADTDQMMVNPCITGDSWVTTMEGPRRVRDLVGTGQQQLLINGQFRYTTDRGFFPTGTKPVYKIALLNGMSIRATSNHQFLRADGQWVEVSQLTVGQKLKLSQNESTINWNGPGSKEEGWLVGNLIGDGTFGNDLAKWQYWGEDKRQLEAVCRDYLNQVSRTYDLGDRVSKEHPTNQSVSVYSQLMTNVLDEKWGVNRLAKHFNDKVEMGSSDFCKGLIGGFFDADGSIWGTRDSGVYVAFAQKNRETLLIAQRILARFGIPTKLYQTHNDRWSMMPDGHGGERLYQCSALFELRVSGRAMVERFFNTFLINSDTKKRKFEQTIARYTRPSYSLESLWLSEIVSIDYDGDEAVYDCTVPDTSCFDCNGIVTHNCVEISFVPHLDGQSGLQGCNLSEINGAMCRSEETFYRGCVAAAILGTLQAGYTDFKFVTDTTKKIFEREALLGVSITGWMNNPAILFDESILKRGAQIVKDTNKQVAKLLGINQAARTTCTKPSGSASVILQTASGIHPEHSPRYLRYMQVNKDVEVGQLIKQANPYMVEDSIWSANNTDYSIAFPIVIKEDALFKKQIVGTKHLELVKKAQQFWVESGTNIDLCVDKSVRHNISNTIVVDDWHAVEDYIFENRHYFTGIALISESGDKDYYQAPFTEVLTAQQIIKKYGSGALFASGMVVDCLKAYPNPWSAVNDVLYGPALSDDSADLIKKDWRRRFKKYANNYFGGDLKKAEYCLKDVYLLHKWEKIQQNLKPVDFLNNLLQKRFTDIDTMGAAACVGVSENGEVGCLI